MYQIWTLEFMSQAWTKVYFLQIYKKRYIKDCKTIKGWPY